MLSLSVFVSIHRRPWHFRVLQSCRTVSSLHATPPALLTSFLERSTAQAGHPESPHPPNSNLTRGEGSAFRFSPRLDPRYQQYGSRLLSGMRSLLNPLESTLVDCLVSVHSKGFMRKLSPLECALTQKPRGVRPLWLAGLRLTSRYPAVLSSRMISSISYWSGRVGQASRTLV